MSQRPHGFFGCGQFLCVADILQAGGIEPAHHRFRSDGDWGTNIVPQGKDPTWSRPESKVRLFVLCGRPVRCADRGKSQRICGGAATYRLSETLRINVNGGCTGTAPSTGHYLTYGLGFDWKFTMSCNGRSSIRPSRRIRYPKRSPPRFQTGVRYRPMRFSRSMSSTAATSWAKMPTGSLLARPSVFLYGW